MTRFKHFPAEQKALPAAGSNTTGGQSRGRLVDQNTRGRRRIKPCRRSEQNKHVRLKRIEGIQGIQGIPTESQRNHRNKNSHKLTNVIVNRKNEMKRKGLTQLRGFLYPRRRTDPGTRSWSPERCFCVFLPPSAHEEKDNTRSNTQTRTIDK